MFDKIVEHIVEIVGAAGVMYFIVTLVDYTPIGTTMVV